MRPLDILLILVVKYSLVGCEDPVTTKNQINEINPDGSFKFR
jgi:hypothetical protein